MHAYIIHNIYNVTAFIDDAHRYKPIDSLIVHLVVNTLLKEVLINYCYVCGLEDGDDVQITAEHVTHRRTYLI